MQQQKLSRIALCLFKTGVSRFEIRIKKRQYPLTLTRFLNGNNRQRYDAKIIEQTTRIIDTQVSSRGQIVMRARCSCIFHTINLQAIVDEKLPSQSCHGFQHASEVNRLLITVMDPCYIMYVASSFVRASNPDYGFIATAFYWLQRESHFAIWVRICILKYIDFHIRYHWRSSSKLVFIMCNKYDLPVNAFLTPFSASILATIKHQIRKTLIVSMKLTGVKNFTVILAAL